MVVVVGITNTIQRVNFLSTVRNNRCFTFFIQDNAKRRKAPYDQLRISRQVQEISRPLYLTMSCFAALGLLFAIICLILNVIYRKRK